MTESISDPDRAHHLLLKYKKSDDPEVWANVGVAVCGYEAVNMMRFGAGFSEYARLGVYLDGVVTCPTCRAIGKEKHVQGMESGQGELPRKEHADEE